MNATGPPAPALQLDGVTKRYAGRTVLDGVSLRVAPGELVALLGPNGAGKTTAVEILEGYRTADMGTVRVLGVDPRRGGSDLRARVGLMLQGGGLDPRSTPRDVLRLYARFHVGGRDPDALLEIVGLATVARTRVRRLSGGERQRLALALALVGDPEVLLLDEPTAGMDPEARRSTRALIAGLKAEGRAILLTTHDLADVERLADRVAILRAGRIVAAGTPDGLAAGASPSLRFRLDRGLSAAEHASLGAALTASVAADVDGSAGAFRVEGRAPDPGLIAALATWCRDVGVQIVELRAAAATLEERYLELTDDRDVESVA
ncbi:MAG: ABC transporter ATP-binding protein [Chloroflexi bacterium]|nr:ABC transporter ATP-binding protein [Chloroflexota bacterium]